VRGRQLFQRKFTEAQGVGPRTGDGEGNIESDASIVAGHADSCAACHGRPRGSAGSGGDVFTRPDSRDAPHLFGLGLQEMLADEITRDLREIRDAALERAGQPGAPVRMPLRSKGIDYGWLTAKPDGSLDFTEIEGVDDDLLVKPFFAEGSARSIRRSSTTWSFTSSTTFDPGATSPIRPSHAEGSGSSRRSAAPRATSPTSSSSVTAGSPTSRPSTTPSTAASTACLSRLPPGSR
jgi:hypothetical protein